jgi:heme-degrading monooxygenase HmoA
MPATEHALLPLASDVAPADVLALINGARAKQDVWYAKLHSNLPADQLERPDIILQQVEDPSAVLILAQWASAAEHWQWIGSEENKAIMEKLIPYISTETERPVVLFHVDAVVLGPNTNTDTDNGDAARFLLRDSPIISVGRMAVDSAKKEHFVAKFNEVKGILEDFASPFGVRGGWRIEKEGEGTDEFVLFCGWESVEKHMDFAKSAGFDKYGEIQEFVREIDLKHYRRFP